MEAFFASKWADSPSGVIRAIRNPWNQQIIDSVPECDEETVELALERLRKGVDQLDSTSSEAMGEAFSGARDRIVESRESLAGGITREQGKPIHEARHEVDVVIRLLDSFGKESFRLGRQLLPLAIEARFGDRLGYTRRRPYGVVAALSPNTFPFLIPAMMVIPALAAGNAVALKPASGTPFSALELVRILVESGIPEGSIACLTGPGSLTGQAICRSRHVDQISCYGGAETIRSIRTACGLVPLQFHHGGMGVCIVAEDADLDLVAPQLIAQSFENAGQTAISTGTVFAADSVYEELCDRLASEVGRLTSGDPEMESTDIGPLSEAFRVARANRMIADVVASGGDLLSGSESREGNLIEPVILAGVDPENPRFFPESGSREILAPVMGVAKLNGELEGISKWMDPRTQLCASLFGRDLDRMTRLARSLDIFNVHVNGIPTWRDGLIFDPGSNTRLGRRTSASRVNEISTIQDVVFHDS